MNAPLSFSEEVSGSAEVDDTPFIGEEVLKRRARRRFFERFEQAFFVGLLLTLIVFTVFVVLSEYTTPSVLASSGPLKVDEESPVEVAAPVRVSWESEPTFETEIPELLADTETYPVVGDTTWIEEGSGMFSLEANPYVAEEPEVSVEAVEAPDPALQPEAEKGMASLPETVPVRAYLGVPTSVEGKVAEAKPPTIRQDEDAAAPLKLDPSGRIGVLRVGGGHARDLIRLYTDPAVVYGLE